MKNIKDKYYLIISSLSFLFIGIFIGWLIFGFNHKKINNEVNLNQNLNTSMEDLTGDMMDNLQNKKGGDFDKSFLEYMATHEWGDINIAGIAMNNSKNEKIKSFASQILTSTGNNMDIIKKLQTELK